MYVQIVEQIQRLISVGDWPRGEEIPSIRQLAVALSVSVITGAADGRARLHTSTCESFVST